MIKISNSTKPGSEETIKEEIGKVLLFSGSTSVSSCNDINIIHSFLLVLGRNTNQIFIHVSFEIFVSFKKHYELIDE